MPSLKQLTCHVEWGSSNVPFKEYGTAYGDGIVDTYIAVPNHPTTFSINLKSQGYIAPGLAMFVFADGVYQCNRNRDQLECPKNPVTPDETDRKLSEIDFRVRQKEEDASGDIFTGRQWRFEPLSLVEPSPSGTQADVANHFKYLGSIQVVVLRCAARPGQFSTSRDEYELSRPLSPESATAPVLDTEDEDDVKKQPPSASVKLADTLWAVYDGPSDGWQTYDPQSGRRYSNGSHTEKKSGGARERSDSRDIDWGGSQGSRRSTNPSVVVNIHTHGSQESNSGWPNRPLSPETQLNSGCYNIKNGKRVHGSQEWRQEKSPSINGHSWSGDNNDTQWSSVPPDDSWAQTNGDRASTSQSNGQGNNDSWAANDHNTDNGNWGASSPAGDHWATGNEQNNPTNDTVDWGGPSNDQNDRNGQSWNDSSDNHGADTGGGGDSSWGNPQDSNIDADGGTSGNDNQNENNSPGNGDAWGNPGDNKSADNNDNGAWGNDDSNQPPSNNPWDTNNNDTNNNGWDEPKNDNIWGSPTSKKSEKVDRRQTSPIPPIHPQPQVYRPPSSHGDFPNRSGGSKPAIFVTPRVVQEPRNDEPLLYTVPVDVAKEKLATHQVQPGPSALYQKKIVTPDYLDTMEKPYAMFVFKYRKSEVIEQMLGITIERDVEVEKKKLEALPRNVIIDQLLRAQGIIPPPTHNGQKGKQKLRAEFPVPNNYTTIPLVPVKAMKSQGATQPSLPPYVAMPPPATTTWVNNTPSWGGPATAQPTQPAYNQTPTVNKPNKSGYENRPPPIPTGPRPPSSPTAVDWSGTQNQPAPDPFFDHLNNKLQTEADKQSVASKDSWATRTSSDVRRRDAARAAPSNGSLGKESSQGKNKQSNNPSGEMVVGPMQTYQPSNSNFQSSPRGGSKKGGSGNSGQPTVATPEQVDW
ncbi:hypothetical protein FQN54_003147 [Arachnomyces sp. PD_36]|nr:hypothetical protein FQN54_003147 [Arachnomyces sp. PD_36]